MGGEVRQLPRGRHRLRREQVVASQRGRMLAAVTQATADKGFADVTVADVITRAGVSRETFYEQFSDKLDCFLSALDAAVDGLVEILDAALAQPAASPFDQLDRVLAAYLDALAAEPVLAKVYLIDAYGAGARATARRSELQQRFVDVVAQVVGAAEPDDRFACEALVAAVSALVTARVAQGRPDELSQLREPLLRLAPQLLPAIAARPKRRAVG